MDATLINILVLVASGSTSVLVGLVFKRLGDVATDVKEIREDVGQHTADLAEGRARIEQLRRDVDGLLDRERNRKTA